MVIFEGSVSRFVSMSTDVNVSFNSLCTFQCHVL